MTDYEVIGIDQYEDPLTHFALFSDYDPTTFEVAVKDSKWRKAMDEEIAAIIRNNIWELTELPKGYKTIGVKWIYKTKLNANGEVDSSMYESFKKSMMVEFNMTDIGMMHYILGLEVAQSASGIFISQKKYAQEILNRFQMKNCNSVSSPTEVGLKLIKEPGYRRVDRTL
ncbi:uncharacterized protein LOC131180591 [Hevea brasiliensis]|uniref:uncharacterized protein LOC131180591 n=1 Tax=Hevea brasiliensis TaxID=3981 RepID=UPI0025E7703F|nr:uncharacterized protein LOC131180591 [Hevea brasiliensis]